MRAHSVERHAKGKIELIDVGHATFFVLSFVCNEKRTEKMEERMHDHKQRGEG